MQPLRQTVTCRLSGRSESCFGSYLAGADLYYQAAGSWSSVVGVQRGHIYRLATLVRTGQVPVTDG